MEKISLHGAWRMHEVGCDKWYDAQVPGSVYADLMRAGAMPDPFWRDNELAAFELMKKDWEYVHTFFMDEAALSHAHMLLRCEGLDTLAHVSLNGMAVGFADNMHVTWEWDVKRLLKAGENELVIRFDSPVNFALDAYEKSPGWCSSDAIPGYPHIRKVHCMFGWDWGPRLPDAGVWRDIDLVLADDARLDSVLVEQEHSAGCVALRLTPEISLGNPAVCECAVTVTAPDGTVAAKTVFCGDSVGQVVIDKPQLWWPHGYGDQPLYTVRVELSTASGQQDVWERRIGLRTMGISRVKDQWGEEFCHVVNGVKVFAMGADYIPEDNIFSRITPERTRRLLEDSVLANFNSVRIWGGGYYPPDFFYDICDELGLMVWQDLMYACAYYDLTPAFEKSIRKETEDNVRRLRHHASLALLCGNNEMEEFQAAGIKAEHEGHPEWYGPVRPSHHADYIKMFEYIMPEICERLAPQTFYWPASPSSGGSFDAPNDPNRGDTHYWDVWHGEKPFTEYRKFHFRYASEFGFQSFPCLKTVESFTEPGDRNIFSRIMERHQRNKAANGKILSYMSQTYRYAQGFDNLLYCSQLLQADAIRYGVEHWRRNRGRCMGAIYWQLNDCWPVASWASLDYYGRWKALHYAAKRFFAPVLLSCEEEGELTQNPCINEFRTTLIRRSAKLNVSNETMQDAVCTVRWSLRTPDGAVVREGSETLTVPALTAVWLDELVFDEATLTGHYLSYGLEMGGEQVSHGSALFCAPKHFDFADPHLRVRHEGDEIIVCADAYAKHVYIESDDADMLISDNFFDMDPGEVRVKVLRGAADNLRVRSVWNMDK
ncbi:MAG: glycoside hydrolase family 2 protein [Clostridia bacterium]|nr:glycoside hydrolase family 2 protein [Clostridia bacterium]